jgi:apolipoprotein N-acyltransferase
MGCPVKLNFRLARIMDQDRGGRQPFRGPAGLAATLGEPAPLAALTGLVLWAGSPPLGAWPVAWVAVGPLSVVLRRPGIGTLHWMAAGWALGFVFYAAQFSWLGYTFVGQGGVSAVSTLVFYVLMASALATVPALALGVTAAATPIGLPVVLTLPLALGGWDFLLSVWPYGGMAWGSLAAPQAHTLAAGLLLPVVGAPGLVAAMGATGAIWGGLAVRLRRGRSPGTMGSIVAMGALTLALLLPWQGPDPFSRSPETRTLNAVLVSGQIGLRELWAGEGTPASLRYYLERTLRALGESGAPVTETRTIPRQRQGPVLAIWPESAVMQPLSQGKSLPDLSRLASLLDVDFLLGADAHDPGRLTNSLYLVFGGRFDFVRYDKRHLVPFGEFVPAEFRWAFGRKVTAVDLEYSSGAQPPVFDWRGIPVGIAICFESILPLHMQDAVLAGAQVLVVAANEAWLPPYARAQHIQLTALRAREAGRDALFVSNGGDTLHLRAGAVVSRLGPEEQALRVKPELRREMTPWVRWGGWGYGMLCISVVGLTLLVQGSQAFSGRSWRRLTRRRED